MAVVFSSRSRAVPSYPPFCENLDMWARNVPESYVVRDGTVVVLSLVIHESSAFRKLDVISGRRVIQSLLSTRGQYASVLVHSLLVIPV